MRTKIIHVTRSYISKKITIKGWVKSIRDQKTFAFINVNDGSNLAGLQVVPDGNLENYQDIIGKITTGTALSATGTVQESPGKGQALELKAEKIEIIGTCPAEKYPLQKKRHSFEFLRTIAHLRPRTNTIGAVIRVRNSIAAATHNFFQEQGFLYIHTPIITSSDCEGAGQMFRTTTLDLDNAKRTPQGKIDNTKDFFGKPTFLTVSGQLNIEAFTCALGDTYTFGPTFRAENSNTSRHLAEFWMIEPELAFADLKDDADCAERYLKHVIKHILDSDQEDMQFFNKFIDTSLIQRLELTEKTPFKMLSYSDAIKLLQASNRTFEFDVEWGKDLQSEHERYLTEEYFKKPVILTDYPKEIKSFYMRLNDDEKTVAAMDVLVSGVGEIAGGSQREERLDMLKKRIHELNLCGSDYGWYLDLRRFGSIPHAGFGVGFERLVQFVTGMDNIRDVIPFPRYPGHAEF